MDSAVVELLGQLATWVHLFPGRSYDLGARTGGEPCGEPAGTTTHALVAEDRGTAICSVLVATDPDELSKPRGLTESVIVVPADTSPFQMLAYAFRQWLDLYG